MLGEIEPDIKVIRNDEMTADEIKALAPDKIIISPGPGRAQDAGMIVEAAGSVCQGIPTLGVCLGHQAICAAYGAEIVHAKELMHGRQSEIFIDGSSEIFKGCPKNFSVGRYHSLAVDKKSIPDCIKITAFTSDDEVMAVQHREYPIYGVQFHPESILTPLGKRILENFMELTNAKLHVTT